MDQLSLEHIVKKYENHLASDDISLAIPKGKIFGLLGPNGAGKTTLIRMITRIVFPDSGYIYFNGEKLQEKHSNQIGYMPEERGLYKSMQVGEHLVYLGKLKNLRHADAMQKTEEWLKRLDIVDWRKKKIEELSKGMAQKVQFIATVLHDPNLLILDEPFSGLDPLNAKIIEDEIEQLRKAGKTIIFSTHRMEQVEEICDEIVLINQGKKILEGDVKELKHQFKENLFQLQFEGELPENFKEMFSIVKQDSNQIIIQNRNDASALLQYFISNQLTVCSFHELLPSLNEIFIRLVNQNNQIV